METSMEFLSAAQIFKDRNWKYVTYNTKNTQL